MARYSGETLPTVFSDDAAFTDPQFHEFREAHDFFIAIHLSSYTVREARVVDPSAPGLINTYTNHRFWPQERG